MPGLHSRPTELWSLGPGDYLFFKSSQDDPKMQSGFRTTELGELITFGKKGRLTELMSAGSSLLSPLSAFPGMGGTKGKNRLEQSPVTTEVKPTWTVGGSSVIILH